MKNDKRKVTREIRFAKSLYGNLEPNTLASLRELLHSTALSLIMGDLTLLSGSWYVSHSGLLKIAARRHCLGIHSHPVGKSSDPSNSRWVFRATVFKGDGCKGFTAYGDADPTNVSALVRGAEMRVAETRAVNRALRKAYGIGICSVEELGSFDRQRPAEHHVRKLPFNSSNRSNGHANNENGTRVRDRLCQLIRQHKLNAELVKSYAIEFCGTSSLREASREQVETFVTHLSDWADKDRNALLCQLNSYQRSQPQSTDPSCAAGAA
jgi:hypothetical protein